MKSLLMAVVILTAVPAQAGSLDEAIARATARFAQVEWSRGFDAGEVGVGRVKQGLTPDLNVAIRSADEDEYLDELKSEIGLAKPEWTLQRVEAMVKELQEGQAPQSKLYKLTRQYAESQRMSGLMTYTGLALVGVGGSDEALNRAFMRRSDQLSSLKSRLNSYHADPSLPYSVALAMSTRLLKPFLAGDDLADAQIERWLERESSATKERAAMAWEAYRLQMQRTSNVIVSGTQQIDASGKERVLPFVEIETAPSRMLQFTANGLVHSQQGAFDEQGTRQARGAEA